MPPTTFQQEDVVQVIAGDQAVSWYEIQRVFPFEIHDTDFNTVSAGGSQGATEISELDPPSGELLELEGIGLRQGWPPDQLLEAEIFVPSSVRLLGTSPTPRVGVLDAQISPWEVPLQLNLFIIDNREPAIGFTNNAGVDIDPELRYFGTRYQIQPLNEELPKDDEGNVLDSVPANANSIEKAKRTGNYSTVTIGAMRS